MLAALINGAAFAAPGAPALPPALDHISADSLRGHVSFLASDLLEGRATPSRGLDIAAEYIAAQFRRAGLTPAGDDGYFQTAHWQYAERDTAAFRLTLSGPGATLEVPVSQVGYETRSGHRGNALPLVRMAAADVAKRPRAADGRALVITGTAKDSMAAAQALAKAGGKPALVLVAGATGKPGNGGNKGWLVDPTRKPAAEQAPVITVHAQDAVDLLEGDAPATVSFDIPEGVARPVKLRNVIGVLPGSDPVLKDTYVIVSAHYDHVGIKDGEVFNGANDDASGTASVMEIAAAMASMKERPRRSIVFMAVWGEELGMVGSRYYGRHPVFPIAKTIANINLEQLGRTDDLEGARVNSASLTGFDYSGVGTVMQQAGAQLGINVYKHPTYSDAFFGRSDNQALADQGVPSHTLCVAFGFPDYHGKDDHADRIDYDNMARVNRMVALGVSMLANSAEAPRWNAASAGAAPYLKAAQALGGDAR